MANCPSEINVMYSGRVFQALDRCSKFSGLAAVMAIEGLSQLCANCITCITVITLTHFPSDCFGVKSASAEHDSDITKTRENRISEFLLNFDISFLPLPAGCRRGVSGPPSILDEKPSGCAGRVARSCSVMLGAKWRPDDAWDGVGRDSLRFSSAMRGTMKH